MTSSEINVSVRENLCKARKARTEKLSPERRKEIARNAGLASGKKGLPRATHGGTLKLGDKEIECGVLPGGIRVISSESLRNALGLSKPGPEMRKKSEATKLPVFFASESLSHSFLEVFGGCFSFVEYVNKSGIKTQGIEATFLPKICEVYLKTRDSGRLTKPQIPIAITADIIMRSLAQVGIIALVDESSGFQEERARDELQTLLKKFINEDLLKWTQRFPHQFFREVYKIHGWKYLEGQCRHPQCLGNFINKYVYDAISPEVRKELENKNPTIEETGRRNSCHHQYLTPDVGIPALDRHLIQTIGLLKASRTKEEFNELFDRVFSSQKELSI